MKLLLITRSETTTLNIQYLLKSKVIFAYTYEEFMEKLHENIDTVGFTTQAVGLVTSSSKFISVLEGIQKLFGYKMTYFSESADSLSDYLKTTPKGNVVESITKYSELDILKSMDFDRGDNIRASSKLTYRGNPEATIRLNRWKNELEHSASKVVNEIIKNPEDLLETLVTAEHYKDKNRQLKRENNQLLSQKTHLLGLAERVSNQNTKLSRELVALDKVNDENYKNLLHYKDIYDGYKETIDDVIRHGVSNIVPNLDTHIYVDETVYPLCILYLKEVTHCRYLSTYLDSFLEILRQNRLIGKVINVLPKGNTARMVKYKDSYDTTHGIDYNSYRLKDKFVHLGNPHTILEFMLSNQMPIDVLIIVDRTPLDNVYCYGPSVVKYNLANTDTDAVEIGISPSQCIVNEVEQDSGAITLGKYRDFSKIKDNKQLKDVYYESVPLTAEFMGVIREVLKI